MATPAPHAPAQTTLNASIGNKRHSEGEASNSVKYLKIDETHQCSECGYTSNLALMIAHVLTNHAPPHNDLPDEPETDWPQVHSLGAAGMIHKQITIYMRAPAKQLWQVLSNSSVLVEGPPGTGKSTLVWLWACHHKGSVAWIFLEDTGCKRLSILCKGKVVLSLPCKIDNSIFRHLQVDCVVLDGATKNNILLLLDEVMFWRQHAPGRQLIITASIQTGIKPERRTRESMSTFLMDGWTEAEYKEALNNAALKAEHNDLDDDGFEAKYSCAGASARWMFGTWDDFKFAFHFYLSELGNGELLLKGLQGDRSSPAVNHLLTSFNGYAELVSKEVTLRIFERHDIAFLNTARVSSLSSNPSFNGWIFEAEVLLQLRLASQKTRVMSVLPQGKKKKNDWEIGTQHTFYDISDLQKVGPLKEYDYLVPQRWNQGCYDFVRLLPECVQFVQVTLAETHSCKVKYMVQLLEALEGKYEVTTVTIVFVVPSGTKFKLPSTMDNLPAPYTQLFLGEKNVKNCSICFVDRLLGYTR